MGRLHTIVQIKNVLESEFYITRDVIIAEIVSLFCSLLRFFSPGGQNSKNIIG
jgi:hypothetical protein